MKDKYIDNNDGRKYFAIIPYYIVNHSTAYEQSLYLVMKRIASEEGTCFASPEYIAKKMRCSSNTVKKYRNSLLKRGWVKKIGQRKSGKTNQLVDEYEIVDLWELNNKYINELKVSNNDTLKVSNKVSKVSTVDEKVSPVAYEEETMKKNKEEEIIPTASVGNDINNIINLFKGINPSYQTLFARKPQRNAIERMLKNMGREKLEKAVKTLERTNQIPFAPTITTPIELENKMGQLISFVQKEQKKQVKNKIIKL